MEYRHDAVILPRRDFLIKIFPDSRCILCMSSISALQNGGVVLKKCIPQLNMEGSWRYHENWSKWTRQIFTNSLTNYIYLQIRVYPIYCWSTWVYGMRSLCSSTVLQSMANLGECTYVWASLGRPFQIPSTWNCGTCNGSHQQARYQPAWCISLVYLNRKL